MSTGGVSSPSTVAMLLTCLMSVSASATVTLKLTAVEPPKGTSTVQFNVLPLSVPPLSALPATYAVFAGMSSLMEMPVNATSPVLVTVMVYVSSSPDCALPSPLASATSFLKVCDGTESVGMSTGGVSSPSTVAMLLTCLMPVSSSATVTLKLTAVEPPK